MIRRWTVHPDMEIPTEFGVLPVVSRGQLVEAMLDAVSLLDRAGGGVSVVVGRERTGVDHEMVTTGAVFEWRDRTETKAAPEQRTHVLPEPPEMPEPAPEDDPTTYRAGEPAEEIDDGLDPSSLEEEDETAMEIQR